MFEVEVNLYLGGVFIADCDQRSVSGFLSHMDSLDWHIDSTLSRSGFRCEDVDVRERLLNEALYVPM